MTDLKKAEEYIFSHKDDIINDLFTLCRIPSVQGEPGPDAPFGAEPKNALIAAEKLFSEVQKTFGGVDILVNNAGISQIKMLCDTTRTDWDRMFSVNVGSMYNTIRLAHDYMVHRKKGSIVNVSSMWGICGASCEAAYSASKAAVIGLTKALAKELGPSGIRVNCVAPGVIDTEMNAHLSSEDIEALKEETPLCRIGTADEAADAVVFLAGDSSSFITGQVLSPTGGMV